MRRFCLALCSVFLLIGGVRAQNQESFVGTKDFGKQKVKIVFTGKPFAAAKHKIRKVEMRGTVVDGKLALGTDFTVPKSEIASIRLFFNQREVPIGRHLFADCYNPNLDADHIKLKFADDGKSVAVFMAGSDAAGSYQVFWIFRNDGRHSRFSSAVSDADYADFFGWFFDNK